MTLSYKKAEKEDIERIFLLSKKLVDDYENVDRIDYDRVLKWLRRKIEDSFFEYTAVYADSREAGYYHFFLNEDGKYELDDFYIFPEHRNLGIGSEIIEKCCSSVNKPVMLYVFVKNTRAIALYKRHGFSITETIDDSRYIMQRNTRSSCNSCEA